MKQYSVAGVAIIVAIAGALLLFSGRAEHPVAGLHAALPRPGAMPISFPAPQFSCPDQDNQPLTTQSLLGKVWIADFIFTHCANTCPKMTDKRVQLQKQINDPRVMFLSFSVDPDRDDRATRKTYAADHNVDQARWKFVCPADKDAALKIAESMKIASVGHDRSSPILHSDRFILIDADARVRGAYIMEDDDAMQRLVTDALALANQPAANAKQPLK